MSRHNNNSRESLQAKCSCGRYITNGELSGFVSTFGYTCPDCKHRQHATPLTASEFYEQINRVFR